MIAYILGFLFFLFSAFGLLSILMGVAAYAISPLLYRITGVGKPLAHFPLWLVTTMLGRAAIVVSDHNDILLKKMRYDDNGTERITLGDKTKEFEDPDDALHSWKGMTFALADELHGVLFDPRHAAAGRRKREADTRGEGIVPASEGEWKEHNISEWVRGVFEFPNHHELVNLADVRHLVDGGERADNPEQVKEVYKNSRKPLSGGTGTMKIFYPILALLATLGGCFAISTQMSGGGGGSTVSFGLAALVLSTGGIIGGRDGLLRVLKLALLWLLVLGMLALLVVTLGPIMATFVTLAFLLGFALIPLAALLGGPVAPLADAFAKLLMVQGFVSYNRPVFEWTPRDYRLREYDDLDSPNDVAWFPFAGTLVGFTFQPGPESWGAEYIPHGDLESRQEVAVADGGSREDSNIPPDCVPLNLRTRGNRKGFGPTRLDDDAYYLHTGILLQRFEDTATGGKSMRRLTEAKKKFGEGAFGVSERGIAYLTVGMGVFGTVVGTLVFLL